GTLVINNDIGNTAGSTGGLLKDTGAGTLELRGKASYQGNTTVRDGVLALNNNAANQAVSNATLTIGDDNGNPGTAEVRLLQAGEIPDSAPITINSDGLLNLNGSFDVVGNLTLNGGSVELHAGGILNLNGNVTVNESSSILATINPGESPGQLQLGGSLHIIDVAIVKN